MSELIVPFEPARREAVPVATHVRGTVLCSSQRALRSRGLFDAYLARVVAAKRDALTSVSAASWVAMDLALAHYAACDALALAPELVDEIGGEMGRRVNESSLSVIVRMTREAGVTPWTAIMRVNRFRDATWRGSSCAVWKLGPKEARVEWVGMPCGEIPYFAFAFAGYIRGILGFFCTRAYVRLMPSQSKGGDLVYRASWA